MVMPWYVQPIFVHLTKFSPWYLHWECGELVAFVKLLNQIWCIQKLEYVSDDWVENPFGDMMTLVGGPVSSSYILNSFQRKWGVVGLAEMVLIADDNCFFPFFQDYRLLSSLFSFLTRIYWCLEKFPLPKFFLSFENIL